MIFLNPLAPPLSLSDISSSDKGEAIASFEKSLLFWPNNSSALLSLAHIDREEGRLMCALTRLTSIVEYTPPYAASVPTTKLSRALSDAGGVELNQDENNLCIGQKEEVSYNCIYFNQTWIYGVV